LIDSDISIKYSDLLAKYHERGLQPPDAIIAATAWSKKLPLLTRNRRHFSYIEEIKLSPIYD
jgi:predicted nucleic acid-binding protein